MKLTKQAFIAKWLEIETGYCPDFILQKLGKKEAQNRLMTFVEENWRFCGDKKSAERVHDYCGIEGAKVEDYLYRQLSTPFGEVVTSIRFVGGDLTKPAVFLIHKDFELDSQAKVKEMGDFLYREYELFQPKRFRWFSPKEAVNLSKFGEGIEGDLSYYTGFLADLKNAPKPASFEKIELAVSTSLDWYERYENSYQDMYRANPFFVEMASVESRESLQDMMDKGLLFEVLVDGAWAGIIGVCEARRKYLAGYEVYEEYLLAEFRGKGLAPAVQRHLIERLPSTANEMLYGTIHHQNIPSIKTAKRCGRRGVGAYVFAEI
ncbi:MAG: N-acetyltransferase family protein [Chitinophagales bacterium]